MSLSTVSAKTTISVLCHEIANLQKQMDANHITELQILRQEVALETLIVQKFYFFSVDTKFTMFLTFKTHPINYAFYESLEKIFIESHINWSRDLKWLLITIKGNFDF